MKPVKDINLKSSITVKELIKQFSAAGGFTAKKLATAVEILQKMEEENCFKFLSFPACIISTGTRGVIKDFVKKKKFDAVITTCGTLDHDLARIWANYYSGFFEADDVELHKKGIHRLGNVFIPQKNYGGVIEKKLKPILMSIAEKHEELSTYELVWEIGKKLKSKDSIIYWAYKNKIPVFVPGITDGAVGLQLFMVMQDYPDFKVNVFKDEDKLADIVFSNEKTGALMIGGGISKHHVIWWNQFKDGLDYAVYVTTAPEWDGSLSGARMREAVSWGKVKEKARYVTVEGDATVLLPLIGASIF